MAQKLKTKQKHVFGHAMPPALAYTQDLHQLIVYGTLASSRLYPLDAELSQRSKFETRFKIEGLEDG